jgi:hypothetical protein
LAEARGDGTLRRLGVPCAWTGGRRWNRLRDSSPLPWYLQWSGAPLSWAHH